MLPGNSQRICESCWIDVEPLHMRKYDWTTIAGNIETWPKNEIWWLNPCKFHVVVWDPCAVFQPFCNATPTALSYLVARLTCSLALQSSAQTGVWVNLGMMLCHSAIVGHCPRCFQEKLLHIIISSARWWRTCSQQSAVGKLHESFIMNLPSGKLT